MKSLFVSLLLLLCAVQPAWCGEFDEIVAAINKGDYATAITLLKPMAEEGNHIAQYNLGVMYERGLGAPQDYGQASAWYRKAAEQGNPDAQNNLGALYEKGSGIP